MMNGIIDIVKNGDLWTAVAGLSLIGLAALIWVSIARKSVLRRWWVIGLSTAMLAGIAGTVAFAPNPSDAIVGRDGVELLLSPFEDAKRKSALDPGETVSIEKTHGSYAYVRTPDDALGWVRMDELSRYAGG